MFFTTTSKPLTNENFECLIKHCPLNSLKEVLKAITFCFDVREKAEFASRVILDYHHRQKTLIAVEQADLILSPLNLISQKGEYKFVYLDWEYDASNTQATPKIFEVDVFDVTATVRKEATTDEMQHAGIPTTLISRPVFRKSLKSKFGGKHLQSGFVVKMPVPNKLVLLAKVKFAEPKLWVKKLC